MANEPDVWFFHEGTRNRDALLSKTRHVPGRIEDYVDCIGFSMDSDQDYCKRWLVAEESAQEFLRRQLDGDARVREPSVCRVVCRNLPESTPLYVASSMPVRDMEYFWPGQDRAVLPYFSRGANGIDGTFSTAIGVAHGNTPSVLFTGDLAFLHDANGALLASKLRGSLTVVLINNDGGGIFGHLPVAGFDPPFEEYFATPQSVDFSMWAAAFGMEHQRMHSLSELGEMLNSLPKQGIRILEVNTNRKEDAAFRKELFKQLNNHLSAL